MKKVIKTRSGQEVTVITGNDETLEDTTKKDKAKNKKASVDDKLEYIIELLESR